MNKKLLIFFIVILSIRKIIFYIIIFIFFIFLCIAMNVIVAMHLNKAAQEKDVDKFIEKYKDESFSEFENMDIFYRSRAFGENIYILTGKNHKNHTVNWGVRYDFYEKKITSINYRPDKDAELDSVYLTDEEVKKIALILIDGGFYSLEVKNKKVYIRLFNNRKFLRLNDTIIKDSMQIRGYIHYKDNWYINEDFNYE